MISVALFQECLWKVYSKNSDGGWDEATEQDCIDVISRSTESYEWWQNCLVPVPKDIRNRYVKLIAMLKESKMLDADELQEEQHYLETFGGKLLAARGKLLSEQLKQFRNNQLGPAMVPSECAAENKAHFVE